MALAENKRGRFDYEIIEEIEAGIELTGFEVKAARAGKMQITGAQAIVRGVEAYLVGTEIAPYQPGNEPDGFDSSRTRRLLLHRQEIERLRGKSEERGLTIVALKVYNKGRRVKVLLGVGRKKKKYDKREKIKKKEAVRKIDRILKM